MTAHKKIFELVCKADLRIETCNLRNGHRGDPVDICHRCQYSKIVYSVRGKTFKHTFDSQCKSWAKQFGDDTND